MRKTSIILLAAALPMAVQAANTDYKFGGYVKFDAMMSKYSEGELAAANLGRDFYVPSSIPVGTAGNDSTATDMGAKTSRFNLKSVTTLDNGEKVVTFVEMDFLGSAQGNEVVSNSYSPRLRHAFFKHGNYTFGQTWTTFMNPANLAETVDFLGVSESTVFARQAMVRYTNGPLQLALENSETFLYNTNGGATVNDDNSLPDLIVRYNLKTDTASVSVAGIARQLSYAVAATDTDESKTVFGFTASGKVQLGKDDLKFSVTKGKVGRYVGLGAFRDGAIAADGSIATVDTTAYYLGYRHFWTDSVRSSLVYSAASADLPDAAGVQTEKAKSVRANVMWTPAPKMTYGVEVSKASRELSDGTDGDLKRLQFTAKYAF